MAGVYLASVIFILFSVEFKNLLTRKLLLSLSFHIFCMLVQFIDSELFGLLFSDFVRELKDTGIQGRGLTGPTPEPSFSSALLTVYALIYACVFLKNLHFIEPNFLYCLSIRYIAFCSYFGLFIFSFCGFCMVV